MRPLLAGVLLLAGCAMNNRMHYLHRYAGEARRMEAANRRFEANDYWGRATVKADSVLARKTTGPEAGTALAVKGEAQAALGQCADATPSLVRALAQPIDREEREYAQLALGRCQLQQGEYERAAESVQPVTEGKDRTRREQARFIMGSAERRLGRDSSAFLMLAGLRGKPAMLERTAAAAGAGYADATAALVDSILALRDSTLRWDALVVDVGQHHPASASALLSGLLARNLLPPAQVPEALYADATRMGAVDTLVQQARLQQLLLVAPGSEPGSRARRSVALHTARHSSDVSELATILDSLTILGPAPAGSPGDSAERAIRRVMAWVDSSPAGAPQGDMRRFLAAEASRDVLRAPVLAAGLFQGIPEGWPESPYAAKAWLAARQLTGDTTSSVAYDGSPYLAALRGDDAVGYRQLEDSLARFARAELAPRPRSGDVPSAGRARPGGGPPTPTSGTRPAVRGGRVQPQRGRAVEDLP